VSVNDQRSPEVDAYIAKLGYEFEDIATSLRDLIFEAIPEITESFKWKQPVYERDGLICYIAGFSEYVALGFYHGAYIDDPKKMLEGTGKQLRHIKIHNSQELKKGYFEKLLQEAANLELR
jgi:hypothetical protein